MRKIKFLLAMALLVFLFSGCGGSAGDDSSESGDASELHETIVSTLQGNWFFNDNDYFSGKATSANNESLLLYTVKYFKISIADITFDNTTTDSEASATVFYSYTSSARYENTSTSLGTFTIRSYSDDTSTTRTQEMVLSRVTDDEWILSSPSSSVPAILITLSSSRKANVQLTGTTYFTGLNSDCSYTINTSFIKTSDEATTDDNSDDSTSTESTITDILTGTWKFSTGDDSSSSASATSNTQGSDKVLTLRLASDVYMTFSNMDLALNNNTTSQTGTAQVVYNQSWTAWDESDIRVMDEGDFTFSRDISADPMKLVQVDTSVWRIEDTEDKNQNVVITVESNTLISTVWSGTATTLDGDSYRYEIECSFRKQ
ncbi:MAG: hypothetical protein IJS40_07220 [Synergistaceae bacterium]|nr:hypothetical protein [Synergistaceae bacterium]